MHIYIIFTPHISHVYSYLKFSILIGTYATVTAATKISKDVDILLTGYDIEGTVALTAALIPGHFFVYLSVCIYILCTYIYMYMYVRIYVDIYSCISGHVYIYPNPNPKRLWYRGNRRSNWYQVNNVSFQWYFVFIYIYYIWVIIFSMIFCIYLYILSVYIYIYIYMYIYIVSN
jgi:hypothetical protein